MDRSRYIQAKDYDGLNPEFRTTCCDSFLFFIHNPEQTTCETYCTHSAWNSSGGDIFAKNMMACATFKRDGKCPLANHMK
jgi:hypothetical protein